MGRGRGNFCFSLEIPLCPYFGIKYIKYNISRIANSNSANSPPNNPHKTTRNYQNYPFTPTEPNLVGRSVSTYAKSCRAQKPISTSTPLRRNMTAGRGRDVKKY